MLWPMLNYDRFIFESYSFDSSSGRIELRYSLDGDLQFTEALDIPVEAITRADHPDLDKALFMLHLIGGISYYKTCLPKKIEVLSGSLSKEQAAFWNDVYENGLGEFFYKNNVDFRELIKFPQSTDAAKPRISNNESRITKVLATIGGGKDSLVTAELLKAAEIPTTLLRIGDHPLIRESAKMAKLPLLAVKRHLSPTLFELNARGAYNGHIPITAYLSTLSVIVAMLTEHTDVAFSNERSANEGNTTLHGKEINHQWSKSLLFEKAFQDYLENYVTKDVRYTSILRPLSELHIAKLFTEYPQHFSCFSSCNANWKIAEAARGATRWCGHCPKCAFAFVLFAAFLPKKTMLEIFERDLFAQDTLIPLYRELLGLEGIKPFECVGTPEETRAAFELAHRRGEWNNTPVIRAYLEGTRATDEEIDRCLAPTDEHAIPTELLHVLPN